jgi:hypothetical protein
MMENRTHLKLAVSHVCLIVAGIVTCFGANSARADFGDELFKLTPSDGVSDPGNQFGWSVAINGNTAIVGAHGSNSGSGVAYLYDVTTGQELFKLTASDGAPSDFFGRSVAISGNIAIIGADLADTAEIDTGEAYVFDVTTGQELRKLIASGASKGDSFGQSVAINGNFAIVGALYDDDACPIGTDCDMGSAYVFDVTTGQELRKLTASDCAAYAQFGSSVAISGNTAIVGARNDDDAGSVSTYLFDVATGQQLRKLTASDAAAPKGFGNDVAVHGTTAVVGASGSENKVGAAYQFDVTTGQEIRKINAPAQTALDNYFGVSVALNEETVLIGAHNYDVGINPNDNAGEVYAFDATTGELISTLHASDPRFEAEFGVSVAISGQKAIVGARYREPGGAAYVFDISRESSVPGDFNNNGTVDAADYIVWRNGLGTTYTQADYNTWRANYGRTPATGATIGPASSGNAAVPEPIGFTLLTLGALPLLFARPCRSFS